MRMPSVIAGIGRFLAGDAPEIQRDPFDEARWWNGGGQMSLAGVPVMPDAVLQLGPVQTVLAGIGGSVSTLPWMVFKRGPNNSRTPLLKHPLTRLLATQPNEEQTPAEFRNELTQQLLFYRNAFARLLPGTDYAIGGLEIIHYKRLQKIERRNGRIFYSFARVAPESGVDVLRDDEIWHIKTAPLTEDGLRGKPIYETAREVFGRALAVTQYGNIWFKNFGATGGTLSHPGNFKSKDDRNDFLEAWRLGGTGANRHKDRLLLMGVQYNPLKVTNAEAQLLQTEQASETEIFGLWSYPPSNAGRLQKSNFSNIEQQSINYTVHAVTPPVVAIEQSATRTLLLDEDPADVVAEFNVAGLMRGDIDTRYSAYEIGRNGGWLSANDIRALENLNPIPGGDTYLIPLNMRDASEADDDQDDDAGKPGQLPGEDEQPDPALTPDPNDDDEGGDE